MKPVQISREVWAMAVIAVVGLAIIASLVHGIWQLEVRLEKIRATEAALQPLLASAEEHHASLLDQQSGTSLTESAEKWARVHLGWARPGEVVLSVPLTPSAATPTPAATPASPTSPSLWQRLQAWLNGEG
jgi:cell division protein FtsB